MQLVRRSTLAVVATATMFAVFAAAPSAHATTGTLNLTESQPLTEDHHGRIVVAADGITLDCAHFRVVGFDANGARLSGAGIALTGHNNVTVRNCNIEGFTNGVLLTNSHSNAFDQIRVTSALGAGCSLNQSHENVFANSRFTNNTGGGCEYVGSHYNRFNFNLVVDNVDEGLDIEQSNNNQFFGNVVATNHDGFDLDDSHVNDILANQVGGNADNGIELDDSSGNWVDDNVVGSNGVNVRGNGITLDRSDGNAIRRNQSTSNGRDGIRISDLSDDNLISANQACHNLEWDGNLDSGSGNTFSDNEFCRQRNIP